jgi:hypothetical protein
MGGRGASGRIGLGRCGDFRGGASGSFGCSASWFEGGAGGDFDGVAEYGIRIAGSAGFRFSFGHGSRRRIDGEGETVFVVGDFVDAIGGMDVELQIMLLVEGLEAGLHERVRALSWRWSMWP